MYTTPYPDSRPALLGWSYNPKLVVSISSYKENILSDSSFITCQITPVVLHFNIKMLNHIPNITYQQQLTGSIILYIGSCTVMNQFSFASMLLMRLFEPAGRKTLIHYFLLCNGEILLIFLYLQHYRFFFISWLLLYCA